MTVMNFSLRAKFFTFACVDNTRWILIEQKANEREEVCLQEKLLHEKIQDDLLIRYGKLHEKDGTSIAKACWI